MQDDDTEVPKSVLVGYFMPNKTLGNSSVHVKASQNKNTDTLLAVSRS